MLAKGEKQVKPVHTGGGLLKLMMGNLEVARSAGKPSVSIERGGLSGGSYATITLTNPGSGMSRMHIVPALYKLDKGTYKVTLSDSNYNFGVQLFDLSACQLIPYRYSLDEGLITQNMTTKGALRKLDAGWVTAGEYEFTVDWDNAYMAVPFKRSNGKNLADSDADEIRAAYQFHRIS